MPVPGVVARRARAPGPNRPRSPSASRATPTGRTALGLKIAVLVGSVRGDRQGIKAARFVERALASRGHDVTVVDPVALQLPLLDRMYKEYPKGTAPAMLEELATLYRATDVFVVVSGEYNHSIPPALS